MFTSMASWCGSIPGGGDRMNAAGAMHRIKRCLLITAALLGAVLVGLSGYIYSGRYDIAADEPHWFITAKIIETLRDRSIDRRARDIVIPDLEDPRLLLKGADQYEAMCAGCHLAPGMENSEIRQGLYPAPPDFSRARTDPARAFWVIKHGIKMTGMPAWGRTHDDITLWSIVALIRKLPEMPPQAYEEMVREARAGEGMTSPGDGTGAPGTHQHEHGHGESRH